MKPTGLEGRGYGHGLQSMLDDSWNKRHALLPPASGVPSKQIKFKITHCGKLGFCHCQGLGEEAFHFHSKMVAMLRPYLFTKKTPTKADETQVAADGKPPVKMPKTYTIARRVLNQAFLIVKLQPKRPQQRQDFFGSCPEFPEEASGTFGGWAALANKAKFLSHRQISFILYSVYTLSILYSIDIGIDTKTSNYLLLTITITVLTVLNIDD